MMSIKKYFPCIGLLAALSSAYSQNVPLISGENKSSLQQDTSSINADKDLEAAVKNKKWPAAAKLCSYLADIKYGQLKNDAAIEFNRRGIEYSNLAGDVHSEVANLYGLGSAYYAKFNYPEAMEHCMMALKRSAGIVDPPLVLRIHNRLGMIYKYLEDYDKAMQYFLPAYNESLKTNSGPIQELLINIGNVEEALGHYRKSIDYYEKYLLLNPQDRYKQVIAYNNMGKVYVKLKELDKALAYFQKAYQAEDTIANPRGRAYSFYDFALVAQARSQFVQAIEYANKSLKLAEPFKIKSLDWNNYQLLADCYERVGNYKMAHESLKLFLALRESIFATKSIDRIHVLDAAYRIERETEKKQLEIASLHKENALKKLQVIKLLDNNKISQLQLANSNKESFMAQLQLHNLHQKDSLNQLKLQNYNKAIMVNSMKVKSLSQQNQLKNLELSLQHRNQLLMIVFTALLVFAFIFFYRRYRFRKLLELDQLRSNIAADFHDELGSTLSSIALHSDMALRHDSQDAHRIKNILSQIGESSRSSVSTMQDMIWAIQPNKDNMNELIFRMKEFAFPLAELKNINLTLHVEEEVKLIQPSMTVRKNIYLVFKEALNNAFKYSLASNIDIALTKQNNFIKLEIKDDGVGFNVSGATAGHGLRNMHQRAEQIGGKVHIESGAGRGTEILFTCRAALT